MRLERFGGYILRICDELPQSRSGKHVEDQLRRSGTAPGAHYSEALGAQSRMDFTYKVSLALKEAREARYWLGTARHAGYLRDADICLAALLDESTQLVAILQAAQNTARNHG